MADIKQYTDAIANAVYGEEVRGSIINALNKVNDDNNKYQEIKTEVVTSKDAVQEAVQQFDGKVANAQQVEASLIQTTDAASKENQTLGATVADAKQTNTDLQKSIASGIDMKQTLDSATALKADLDASVKTGSALQTSLDGKIQQGTEVDTTLGATVKSASAANGTLTGTIGTADQKNSSLIQSINAATTVKGQVDGSAREAQTVKAGLDGSIKTAGTVKGQVEAAVQTATTTKGQLDDSNAAAVQTNTTLQKTTEGAGTANTTLGATIKAAGQQDSNLKGSIQTGSTLKGQLDQSTAAGQTAKNNLDLVIPEAQTAKQQLDDSKAAADLSKKNLDGSKTAADTSKTQLDGSIKTAGTTKGELDQSIQTAGTTNETLTGSIAKGSQLNTDLQGSTTAAETMKGQLETATTAASEQHSQLQTEVASADSHLKELRSENFNSQEILAGVTEIRGYLGMVDMVDVPGIEVDYAGKSFKRLSAAVGLTAGADFDKFPMYGGRKRCNVGDDGTIKAWFGDPGYTEDGSNGQVMVYQPKFYYLVVPVDYEPIANGMGYHLRKANYYVSPTPKNGFRLHPAFYDEAGNQVDYILLSAYEGSVYDSSAAAYLLKDEQVSDFNADLFCSIGNAKPASGQSQNLTRPNIEQMAKNRGKGWHSDTIKTTSANQLLMVIEMGMMNMQTAIGQGITQCSDVSGQNCAANTGSTTELGNATGMAAKSTFDINGVITTETTNGKVSVTYRGMENPWGNLWKFVYGCNIHGDGSQGGGIPYICQDFNFAEGKITDNYVSAGFQLTPKAGYISAMGYSPACDWLFMPSECTGNSSVPVGDYTYITENLNGHRIVLLGSNWGSWGSAGAFCWNLADGVGSRGRRIGGRLVYIPTGKAA